MANIMDDFPSKYLKASDVEDHPTATISRVTKEEVGQTKDMRPIVYFDEFDKGVVLNKTNATNISKLYGFDTDNWLGKSVILGTAMVDFQGQSVESIRIWPPKRATQSKTPLKQRQPEPEGAREFAPLPDDGDDIPF